MDKEFEKSLGPWFGMTMKMIDNRIEELLEESGIDLTKLHFIILKKVKQNEGVKQNDLAFFTNRNKSSLTRIINTLEKKNYIARIPSKEDKRINQLYITIQGEKMLEKAKPLFMKFAGMVESGLSKEEIENTIEILKRIQKNVLGEEFGSMIK